MRDLHKKLLALSESWEKTARSCSRTRELIKTTAKVQYGEHDWGTEIGLLVRVDEFATLFEEVDCYRLLTFDGLILLLTKIEDKLRRRSNFGLLSLPLRGAPAKWKGKDGFLLIQQVERIRALSISSGEKPTTAAILREILKRRGVPKRSIEKQFKVIERRYYEALKHHRKRAMDVTEAWRLYPELMHAALMPGLEAYAVRYQGTVLANRRRHRDPTVQSRRRVGSA